MTPGVEKMVHSGSIILSDYLCRHLTCDWGDVNSTDRTANEHALSCGGPLLSAYRVGPELTLRFITEAGRLVTTAFLPGECLSPP